MCAPNHFEIWTMLAFSHKLQGKYVGVEEIAYPSELTGILGVFITHMHVGNLCGHHSHTLCLCWVGIHIIIIVVPDKALE